MKAVKLQLATRTLQNAAAPQWAKVPVQELSLGATPLQSQPSRYVRTAWAGKPLGAVRALKVQAAHNGKDIVFRLEWPDATKNADYGDGSVFPDAAGILFPLNGEAPLETMGSQKSPVNAWFWRASFEQGKAQSIVARGLGTAEQTEDGQVQASGRWADGAWTVVFARPIATNGAPAAPLASGKTVKVAFAVWEGSSQERAGLKSFSKSWQPLEIE